MTRSTIDPDSIDLGFHFPRHKLPKTQQQLKQGVIESTQTIPTNKVAAIDNRSTMWHQYLNRSVVRADGCLYLSIDT